VDHERLERSGWALDDGLRAFDEVEHVDGSLGVMKH
jgi:hypothetical protein